MKKGEDIHLLALTIARRAMSSPLLALLCLVAFCLGLLSVLPLQCQSYSYLRLPSRLLQDPNKYRQGSAILFAKKKSKIEKEEAKMKKQAAKEKLRITSWTCYTAALEPKPISTIVSEEKGRRRKGRRTEDREIMSVGKKVVEKVVSPTLMSEAEQQNQKLSAS